MYNNSVCQGMENDAMYMNKYASMPDIHYRILK